MAVSFFIHFIAMFLKHADKPVLVSDLALECPLFFLFFLLQNKTACRPYALCFIYVAMSRIMGVVSDSPHTWLLLSTSSKALPTTALGMANTSGHAAISSCDQQGRVRADSGFWASARVHFVWSNINASVNNVETNGLKIHFDLKLSLTPCNCLVTGGAWCWITIKSQTTEEQCTINSTCFINWLQNSRKYVFSSWKRQGRKVNFPHIPSGCLQVTAAEREASSRLTPYAWTMSLPPHLVKKETATNRFSPMKDNILGPYLNRSGQWFSIDCTTSWWFM